MRILYTLVIFGCIAHGQTSNRVFSFAHLSTAQDFQATANLIRAVGGLQQVSIDSQAGTLTVTGAANEIDLANWLFHSIDVEPQATKPAPLEYTVPGNSDDVARVFYLSGDPTRQDTQELVNVLHTIAGIKPVYPLNGIHAIALRGTAVQVALAEWILHALFSPPAVKAEYVIPGVREVPPRWSAGVVRVFYLSHTKSAQEFQEVANALRTVTEMSQIYQHTGRSAIVLLGNTPQIALAEWLIDKLDRPAGDQPASASFTASIPNTLNQSAVRIFYLPPSATQQALAETLKAVRLSTGIGKIYSCPAPRALVLRGTPAQALQAESLMANH